MLKAFLNIFRIPDLRKRFLFTLGILVVYRIGCQIPVPGVDWISVLKMTEGGGNLADFFSLFTGGAKENISIFSLGVMPYITAIIILQLLTAVVPSLNKLNKEGPEGKKKIQQYGRMGTVLVTLIQGVIQANGMLASYGANILAPGFAEMPFLFVALFTLSVTAGTLILMWMGEQITERGIGNGVSLIIMAGIIARMPHALLTVFSGSSSQEPLKMMIIIAMFFIVIGLVVFEEQGLRKIPIQYANRVVGGVARAGQVSYLPFKVNPTGVIPIIFASSILVFPSQLTNWFPGVTWLRDFSTVMQPGKVWYSAAYFVMIMFFAYFYLEIELNPHDIAENLRKQGGFIPGVRPGQQTEEHISHILTRITFPGAMFLGLIALMPNLVINFFEAPPSLAYLMGGTSLLIMVGVALDFLKQTESHLLMHHFDGFLTKSKIKK